MKLRATKKLVTITEYDVFKFTGDYKALEDSGIVPSIIDVFEIDFVGENVEVSLGGVVLSPGMWLICNIVDGAYRIVTDEEFKSDSFIVK